MLKRTRSFLVLVMLLMTVTMSAQVTTATMSGKVTAQDEPIIGATIVAIHEPSGTRYGTVTNVSGQFNLQGMRTGGPYKVEISYVCCVIICKFAVHFAIFYSGCIPNIIWKHRFVSITFPVCHRTCCKLIVTAYIELSFCRSAII